MIFLYWEVYVLMGVAVNFLALHWFCGRSSSIDGGVLMYVS